MLNNVRAKYEVQYSIDKKYVNMHWSYTVEYNSKDWFL